jgi:hypothetical protein
MIIIGSTQLTFTTDTGTFRCPNCNELSTYRRRKKREFLTIYFIPLIPLQTVGEYIECAACREALEPAVLEMTADAFRASRRRGTFEMIRRVLVVVVAADDRVTEDELDAVRDFAGEHDLPDISREQILQEAAGVRLSQMDQLQYIAHVANQLSDEDKDLLVVQAFLAATAGGELSETRQSLLKDLPGAIGVPEERFRTLIAGAVEQ